MPQISLYFSSNSLQEIYLDLPNSLLYVLISITHKDLTFLSSWYPIKHLQPFFPNEILLDTTALPISTSFIKIGFCICEICGFQLQYNVKRYILFTHFIYCYKFLIIFYFCNTFFSINSTCSSKFNGSILLIH